MTVSSSVSQQLRSSYVRQERIVIHWFRNTDLRLLDNDALSHTSFIARGDETTRRCKVIPIYCFDTSRIFGKNNTVVTSSSSSTRVLKCSPRRAQFIIESVLDLRKRLQETYQSQLLIGVGNPAEIFDKLLSQLHTDTSLHQASSVYGNYLDKDMKFELHTDIVCQDEPVYEERQQVREVTEVLTKYHPLDQVKRVQRIWGSTLYTPYKMPYDPSFRNIGNKVQGFINRMVQMHKVREVLPIPKYLPFLKRLEDPSSSTTTYISDMITYVPTLHDLGYTPTEDVPPPSPAADLETATMTTTTATTASTTTTTTATRVTECILPEEDPRSQIRGMKGGETAGLQRIQDYIWETETLNRWSKMRQGPIVQNQSTKFSMYLAHGCISARYIADEARKFLNERKAKYAYTIAQQDLVHRDFCKYYARKHGQLLFRKRYGPVPQRWGDDRYIVPSKCPKQFTAWVNGLTGYPLIDACMRELKTTGFIQDRCRLLAASFLCNDLNYEWTYGANYFESVSIDYNVFCNWVNWAMVAGLTDGHCYDKLRYNHEYKQFDRGGEYIRLWVHELQHLPKEFVTEPWRMTSDDETEHNFRYGTDYPYRIVLPRIKAVPHRNEDDVIVIREMMKRKISVKGIKGLKAFLKSFKEKKKAQLQEQKLLEEQKKNHDVDSNSNNSNDNDNGMRY